MNSRSKGITPVIAIVLLLLITVGAVGVVYTQFQNVVGEQDAAAQAQQQQKIQQASYSIVGVDLQDATTDPVSDYGVTVRNTGDVTLNLTQQSTILVGVDGQEPVAASVQGGSCSLGAISPGSTGSCTLGISTTGSRGDGQATTIQLQVGNALKASYTCTEPTNGQYC